MYVPAAFAEDRPEFITAFLAAHPMAQLVTMADDGLVATPLPMLYEPAANGFGSLVGHVARANRQWAETIPSFEALAIFTGSNAYVSPNWYPSKAEHGKVVPTWNYETVHIRGRFAVHDDSAWKRALVTRLTQHHESRSPVPWTVEDAPPEYIDAMIKAIVGIEVEITAIQAKRKLSQNRVEHDIDGTIEGLTQAGGPSALVAQAMRSLDPDDS
jgi:transcriptional regulator